MFYLLIWKRRVCRLTVKIKDVAFELLINHFFDNGFATDGCACGDFCFKLDEELYINFYRGCRKSSSCPSGKWWHINSAKFYKDVKFYRNEENVIVDYDIEHDSELISMKLDARQEAYLLRIMRKRTEEVYGQEFKTK